MKWKHSQFSTLNSRSILPIAWISLNIFDHKSCILSGKKSLYLWPAQSNKSFANFCIASPTDQNPNKSFSLLKAEFPAHQESSHYPSPSEIVRLYDRRAASLLTDDCLDMANIGNATEFDAILGKDSLAELTEQDKHFLWTHRYDCMRFVETLSRKLGRVVIASKPYWVYTQYSNPNPNTQKIFEYSLFFKFFRFFAN